MNRNFKIVLSLCVIAFTLGLGQIYAQQIYGYDFSTGTTSFETANSSATNFFPSTPTGGGTYRIRTSTNGGGGFYRDDPGLTSFGSGTELRIMAPTTSGSSNINKFAVHTMNVGNNDRNAYQRFSFRLGSAAGGFADSGTFYYFFGNGTSYTNDAVITNTEAMVGIRWVLGTGGTVTASYMAAGTWTALTGYTFQQGINYTIEFRIHNGPGNSGESKTYVVGGTTYQTTIYTYDIWINGTRLAGFPSAGFPQNNSFFDDYMFYAESSTNNVGAIFLDDINSSSAIDVINSPIYYSKSTGSLHTLATWGVNTDGTGTAPANFTTAAIGYYIRNNASPTITANWAVSGSAARVELGNGTNACTFTVPSNFTYTGPIDVNNLGVLNLQNTVYPSIGLLHTGSTVRYSVTGNQDVLGLNYYNLSIQGTGTKTLNNNAFAANLTDVGDGTNAVTLTIPSTFTLSGTVNVLNAGILDIQNTVNPTLGTLSSGSTVRYSAAVDQNVAPAAYSILQAYGTGNKTLTGNVTVGNRAYVGDGTNTVTLTVPTQHSHLPGALTSIPTVFSISRI